MSPLYLSDITGDFDDISEIGELGRCFEWAQAGIAGGDGPEWFD